MVTSRKTTRFGVKTVSSKKETITLPKEDINIKVRVSGKSIKMQDVRPTGISELKDTLKETSKLIKEDSLPKNEENSNDDDYYPEVLSTFDGKASGGKNRQAILVMALVIIIAILISVIIVWYYNQYNSKNLIKDLLARNTSLPIESTPLSLDAIEIDNLANKATDNQEGISAETPEIDKGLLELDRELNNIDRDEFPEEPNISE